MQVQADLVALAVKISGAHNLPSELVCAVCEEESGRRNSPEAEEWDPAAVKPERGFFEHYIHPMLITRPTTEELLRSWSFGLMQILGETARERGFAGRFLTELCMPAVGLEFGCRHLALVLEGASNTRAAGSSDDEVWARALEKWNGGGDLGYAGRVLNRVTKYRRE
jgi:hypothetical protein